MAKFVCGYCGKEYETPYERSVCEQECHKKELEATKALKEQELKKCMAEDTEKIEALFTEYHELYKKIVSAISDYQKKYNKPVVSNRGFDGLWDDLFSCFF